MSLIVKQKFCATSWLFTEINACLYISILIFLSHVLKHAKKELLTT